jgi:hypothetical protein
MNAAGKIISFYWQGFRSMRTGKTLWLIIIIKLIIIFGFLKLVFYPDHLHTRFDSDTERAAFVLDTITEFPDNKSGADGL